MASSADDPIAFAGTTTNVPQLLPEHLRVELAERDFRLVPPTPAWRGS